MLKAENGRVTKGKGERNEDIFGYRRQLSRAGLGGFEV